MLDAREDFSVAFLKLALAQLIYRNEPLPWYSGVRVTEVNHRRSE
jgi:hypothetical protein